MNELTERIEDWAIEKKLHVADPTKQILKLGEEYGELCQGMVKSDYDLVIDSIGDMYVVLTILSKQLGVDINRCVEVAYSEIKDRKGEMINGVFVKQEDIKGASSVDEKTKKAQLYRDDVIADKRTGRRKYHSQ